ncbi:hypothetical protein M8369_41445, partial [Klebsiella pneumoniae]|nr:hypothetical protein [Klebsiella pneumoniae]
MDVLGQAKQRADVAQAQDASLQLSQISSDLLNNPDILRNNGYEDMASQYDVFDKQAMAIDAVLGLA